ncbi:MAG: hypothetical protein NTZ17_07290 [Phycisphaerae bacterium]|nr:hypothetical protein [Phycisphaerae bacterium]
MSKNALHRRIARSLLEAKHFFERNLIFIPEEAGGRQFGFPVTEGKKRITEWGATSAGVRSLLSLGPSSHENSTKCQGALEWLIAQQRDGAWEASDFFSAEATAGVLLDLFSVKAATDDMVNRAVEFVSSCYRDGHYNSTPSSTEKPHIYTTYIVTKCLWTCGRLDRKNEISKWVLSSRTSTGIWGKTPSANVDSPIHTIYAYQILTYCGLSREGLLNQFGSELKSALIQARGLSYVYEEIEVARELSDPSGLKYHRLRIQHFVPPALGHLSVMLHDKSVAFFAARAVLEQQFAGGWGPSNDELVMWATAQAVEYLSCFEKEILPTVSWPEYPLLSTTLIPYGWLKFGLSLLGLATCVTFLLLPGYRENMVAGLFLMVAPWFFSRST